jgi:hypothetical protein
MENQKIAKPSKTERNQKIKEIKENQKRSR